MRRVLRAVLAGLFVLTVSAGVVGSASADPDMSHDGICRC